MNDEQLVNEFLASNPLRIASRALKRFPRAEFMGLPRDENRHWRGILQVVKGKNVIWGRFCDTEEMLEMVDRNSRTLEFRPRGDPILCHCKPLNPLSACGSEKRDGENRFPDIPDRWDIYMLLRYQIAKFAFTGLNVAALIERTDQTFETLKELQKWEGKRELGKYRRSRVRSQIVKSLKKRFLNRAPLDWEIERAHAKSALRHIGLQWPAKPTERHRKWPDCLRALGLTVTVEEAIPYSRP